MSPNRAKRTSSSFPWLSAFFLTHRLKSRGEEFQKECPKFLKPRRSTEHDSVMPDDDLLSYSWRSEPKESTTSSSYVSSTQRIASSTDKSRCLPSACNGVLTQSLVRRSDGATAAQTEPSAHRQPDSGDVSTDETDPECGTPELLDSPKEWWVNADYFWVVLCKNEQFHNPSNTLHAHWIPLGQTDTLSHIPVSKPFRVRWDSCGREYIYAPSD
jgi:hypothetical protein